MAKKDNTIWWVIGVIVVVVILVGGGFGIFGGKVKKPSDVVIECGGISGERCQEGFFCELFEPDIRDSLGRCIPAQIGYFCSYEDYVESATGRNKRLAPSYTKVFTLEELTQACNRQNKELLFTRTFSNDGIVECSADCRIFISD